ncbi:hypothetical protein B0I33_104163 [Prauserella shujinwangii]|uniref:Uncharacterized protein n=1 Tax=Prauserella shujinwangii TaxID=1453103 RepID=A0A2T0LWH2_9PSEU|nr:hypothetical protein [Prauserella shujinwangii]PRX48347.1 hypothetical protein B0I33_104163 [Prauserella shujinwangii]
MAPSPGSGPRAEVAPPRESAGTFQRTGYLALAVSGLLLATAFGAIAQVAGPSETVEAGGDGATVRNGAASGQQGGPQLVPGQAIPGETTILVDGVAVTGTLPPSTTAPTTVVSKGPDGQTTTTVITPSATGTTPGSGRSDHTPSPGGGGRPVDPGTSIPGTTSTQQPTTTTPPDTGSSTPPDSGESSPPPGSDTSEPSESATPTSAPQ